MEFLSYVLGNFWHFIGFIIIIVIIAKCISEIIKAFK